MLRRKHNQVNKSSEITHSVHTAEVPHEEQSISSTNHVICLALPCTWELETETRVIDQFFADVKLPSPSLFLSLTLSPLRCILGHALVGALKLLRKHRERADLHVYRPRAPRVPGPVSKPRPLTRSPVGSIGKQ